jgi:large subunit ribosomal protein L20
MPRSKNKVAAHRRKKKVLDRAKGYWGARSKLITIAKHHVDKGLQYAYRDRRAKKRLMRALWIIRINAAARMTGTTYAKLIGGLNKKHIAINRKLLAQLAVSAPETFNAIVKTAVG